MPKREYRLTHRCAETGCAESTTFYFDRRSDEADHRRYQQQSPWKCTRHTGPDRVLGADNLMREVVLVASKVRSTFRPEEVLDGQYWIAEGKKSGSGFTYGPGFKAFAADFPEGTRLVVTARIELASADDTKAVDR